MRAVATDVLSVFRFQVDAIGTFGARFLDTGNPQAGFVSVTVPEISVETIEYREGHHTYTKRLPGIPTMEPITLRRGVVRRDSAFWNWMKTVIEGSGSFRATVEIKHYSRARPGDLQAAAVSAGSGNPLGDKLLSSFPRSGLISPDTVPARIYRVVEAFPVRCKLASDLEASDGSVSIAELDLAYEYIEMDLNE